MPLEEQERLLDEEEEKSEKESLARPSMADNVTMCLPDQGDFERMAKASSTPFTG
jgi:hypothetical protein